MLDPTSRWITAAATALAITALTAPAASASSHTVEIVAPMEGTTVTGPVVLRAATTVAVGSVEFSWATDPGGPWTSIGPGAPNGDGSVWTLEWDSDGVDGPGSIRAVAREGGGSEAVDVVAVVFDNRPAVEVTAAPTPFSPNADGRRDRTTITVDADETGEAIITILDGDGVVVRRWRRDIGAAEIVLDWNGRAGGHTVADGVYRVRAEVTDDAGLTGADVARVRVDTRAPRLHWLEISPEPVREQDEVRFRFHVRDRGSIRLRLDVSDRTGRIARRRSRAATGERTIEWRPRYAGGGRLFPGQYGARLLATDEAGNRRRSPKRPWRVHRTPAAHVYTRLPAAGRRVALTFDDCFREDAWRSILDTLETRDTDATFFCVGGAAARARSLVRRTVREGHVFASHTWDHARLTTVSATGTRNRIEREEAFSWRVARYTTAPYFRPPFGSWDADVLRGAAAASHPRVIMWDVDTLDWTLPGSRTIVRRSVRQARPGSIILLHTLPQTAAGVSSIITGLRRKGLRPVTIAELFEAAGYRSG